MILTRMCYLPTNLLRRPLNRLGAVSQWAASLAHRWPTITCFLVLLAVAAAMFPKAFLSFHAIAPGDLIYYYPPWRTVNPLDIQPGPYVLSDQMDAALPSLIYTRDRLADGELPSYTDRVRNGSQHFWPINTQEKVAPLLLLTLLFGVAAGWTLYILAKIVVGGLFFMLFLRTLGLGQPAATIAAVAYAFASFPIQKLGIAVHLQYALLPIVLYAIERIIRDRSLLWMGLLPILLHLDIVSGYPPGTAYGVTLFAAYGLLRLLQQDRGRWRLLAIFLSLGVVSILISLPALWESVLYLRTSYDTSYRGHYWASGLRPGGLPTLLAPFYYGPPTSPYTQITWVRHATYIGIVPILMAALCLFTRNWSPIRWLFLAFLGWLLLVLYNLFDFLNLVYRYIPVLNWSMPNNQIQILVFVLVVLASFGLHDLMDADRRRLLNFRRLGIWLFAILAATSYLLFAFQPDSVDKFQKNHYMAQILIAVLGLALIALVIWSARARRTAIAALLVLTAVDLVAMGRGFNNTVPYAGFYPETRGIRFVKERVADGKVFLLGRAFLANTPFAFDIPTIAGRGFFNQTTRDLYRLINPDAFAHRYTQYIFPVEAKTNLLAEIVNALGIRLVVVPDRTEFEDLVTDYLIRINRANGRQRLSPGVVVSQTFIPKRDFAADALVVRVRGGHLSDRTRLLATIRAQDGTETGFTTTPQHVGPWLRLDLDGYRFESGGRYRIDFTLQGERDDALVIRYAHGRDYLPSGRAFAANQALQGDLTLHILRRTPGLEELKAQYRVIHEDDLTVWENTHAFDRAWLVANVETLDAPTTYERMRRETHSLADWAWIDDESGAPHPLEMRNPEPLTGHVTNVVLKGTVQRFRVEASRPALLVISDNYHPGWQASIDGEPTPLLKANYAMRAVAVPAGNSVVELRYAPPSLTWGLWIAVATLVLFAGGMVALGLRRQRQN